MGGMEGAGGTMDEEEDDEVPDLVENFDEVSKNETATEDAKISEVTEETEETLDISVRVLWHNVVTHVIVLGQVSRNIVQTRTDWRFAFLFRTWKSFIMHACFRGQRC